MRASADRIRHQRARRGRRGGGRDSCPEQVEQESRGIAQHAHAQARISLAALEALIVRLKELPGPKTIVLLSEGMIVDPRRVDVAKLAADAQAARVTIYALLLESPVFDATQARVAPTATRDRQVRQDGIEQVAGAARGAVFRLAGDDPAPFARITRELAGHYLLAFEAADSDRDARAHRIAWRWRAAATRCARARALRVPASPLPARGAQLSGLLRTLSTASELPLRIATYTYAEPARGALRVVVSADAGDGDERVAGVRDDRRSRRDCGDAPRTSRAPGGMPSAPWCPKGATRCARRRSMRSAGRAASNGSFAPASTASARFSVGDLMLAPVPATRRPALADRRSRQRRRVGGVSRVPPAGTAARDRSASRSGGRGRARPWSASIAAVSSAPAVVDGAGGSPDRGVGARCLYGDGGDRQPRCCTGTGRSAVYDRRPMT